MALYVELLTGLVTAILGRITYIGSNFTDFPGIVFIVGVSIILETFILFKNLLKGD